MPSRERVLALIAMVEQGRFVEAIEEFYTEDATMQENGESPRGCLDGWRVLHRECNQTVNTRDPP